MVYSYINIEELLTYKYRGYVASRLRIPKPDSFLPCVHSCQPYNQNAENIKQASEFEASVILQLSMPSFLKYIWYWKSQL